MTDSVRLKENEGSEYNINRNIINLSLTKDVDEICLNLATCRVAGSTGWLIESRIMDRADSLHDVCTILIYPKSRRDVAAVREDCPTETAREYLSFRTVLLRINYFYRWNSFRFILWPPATTVGGISYIHSWMHTGCTWYNCWRRLSKSGVFNIRYFHWETNKKKS